MTRTPDSAGIAWYNQHAAAEAAHHDRIDPAQLWSWMRHVLPADASFILDIGAGSGRDAAWLASLGHHVVAVEPAQRMREYAQHYHDHPHIEWLNDRLPSLEAVYARTAWVFDCIVVSAVWMFVPPHERPRAFRKMVDLLKPGGTLVMSIQLDERDEQRGKYAVSPAEITTLAHHHGLIIEIDQQTADIQGRPIRWQQVVLRVPDDGTGALPFLRHLILNDRKSSTYKLGLLRTMVRVADAAPGLAQHVADATHVELPFGLIGLYWVRLYQPLTRMHLPQMPLNTHADTKLGFAGSAYRQLPDTIASDLAIGSQFRGETAHAIRGAIKDACDLIKKMPATYITYDDGRPVFEIDVRRALQLHDDTLVIDDALLWSYGSIKIPRHMWQSMVRFCAWIEPALIYEWQNLMHTYAHTQGRKLDYDVMHTAMQWYDPVRTVAPAKIRAMHFLAEYTPLYCVWSGKRLDSASLDIDHVFPWVAKPCGDMWNLVPAARTINQHEKRDRLVSAPLLDRAAERLYAWWDAAYLHDENSATPQRFYAEAKTSLAISETTIRALLLGMHQLRLQLRQNQQIPEWLGPKS